MMEEKVTRHGTTTPLSSEEDSSEDGHVGKLTIVNGNGSPKANPKGSSVGKKREDMDEVERGIYDEQLIACSIEVT